MAPGIPDRAGKQERDLAYESRLSVWGPPAISASLQQSRENSPCPSSRSSTGAGSVDCSLARESPALSLLQYRRPVLPAKGMGPPLDDDRDDDGRRTGNEHQPGRGPERTVRSLIASQHFGTTLEPLRRSEYLEDGGRTVPLAGPSFKLLQSSSPRCEL